MRLTEKVNYKDNYINEHFPQYDINIQDNSDIKTILMRITNKLGQLEDIEEELGIDLITLFNILRTGGHIWIKNCKGINEWHVESLKQRGLDGNWYLTYSNNVRVKLKDYGKTWALTKEKLL